MKKHLSRLAFVLATVIAAPVGATVLTVDVSGIASKGVIGTAANTVLSFNVGAFAHISGLSWQLDLEAFNPSWLSEMQVSIGGSQTAGAGLLFAPGAGSDFAGRQAFGGSLDLAEQGLDFSVGADGLLRLEFSEAAADGLSPDGRWTAGQLNFELTAAAVPEPASYALLGVGLLLLGTRQRRGSVVR
jgi:hypothetical protein